MRDHAVRYGQDSGVVCRIFGAVTLWLLGYPDQARQWSEAALTHAQGLHHAFSLAQALCFSTLLHLLRGEAAVAQERAEAQRVLCTEQGFAPYLAWGTIEWGAALAAQGAWTEGLAQMREGLAAYRTRGRLPWLLFLGLLAEACGRAGQVEEGLRVLEEALAARQTTEERMYEAEVYRLRGDLLLRQSVTQQGEAEKHFHQALTVARRQHAKAWELRAAMSLSRLWRQQGKRQEAHDLLGPDLWLVHRGLRHCRPPRREDVAWRVVRSVEVKKRPLVAHCHLGLGKLYRRTGKREQAHEHLTTATTMYREMGMTYWLEQAETEGA
jgi:predicted ATPase